MGILAKFFEKKSKINKKSSADSIVVGQGSTFNFSQIKNKQNCFVTVGTQSMIDCSIVFECDHASVHIGNNTFIGASKLVCSKKIIVGNDVLIAWGCTIVDHNSHSINFSLRKKDLAEWMEGKKDWTHVIQKKVTICDKAWIGFNTIILKGITVGEGAIVGAGSVLTKDVPPWTIVGGNPARVIREIPENER